MSLYALLDIGKSAIFASQTALAVTNNNIANVNTPGYSRQEIVLELTSPLQTAGGSIGRGVSIAGIKRNYDNFIQMQLTNQYQNLGRAKTLEQAFSQVEGIFNEQNGMGLSESMNEFFLAWQDVALNPEGYVQRHSLLQKANSFVRSAKTMEQGLNGIIQNIDKQIDSIIDRINNLAEQISSLNKRILSATTGKSSEEAPDLRDQRDSLINELADLIDLSTYENADGTITITIGMRNLVSGENVKSISKKSDNENNPLIYLDGININSLINRGQIGGMLAARSDIANNSLFSLRKLIASITKEINLLHQNGFGLDGSTGNNFFSPIQLSQSNVSAGASMTSSIVNLSQLTLDEYDITFDATATNYTVTNRQTGNVVTSGVYVSGSTINFDGIDVTITGPVTAQDRFSVSPVASSITGFNVEISDTVKIAAASNISGIPGDGSNAITIARIAETDISVLGSSFNSFYQSIVSYVGISARAAEGSRSFEENLLADLNARRDAVSGVSLDEEAVNVIKFQRAFEAGARMIRVTDELIQTILNL